MIGSLLTILLSIGGVEAWKSDNHTCAIRSPVYSCENTTQIVDTCCVPTEGLVLATQFWSTYTGNEQNGSVLPKDSWTIHGLWPDRCDGTYGQYCDLTRQYDPEPSPNTTDAKPTGPVVPPWTGGDVIGPILEKYGKWDLLAFMERYWKAQNQPDWAFWAHEYSKHATCFSTFDVGNGNTPDCYGGEYVNSTEASIIDFFESAIKANLQYPTFEWLGQSGIVPSNTTAYDLSRIEHALTQSSGALPYVGCRGTDKTILNEVWYYSHSLGRPQDGIFKPLNQTTRSNCNTTRPIWYYERTATSEV